MKEMTRHRLAFDLYVRLGANRSLQTLHEALEDDPSLVGLKRAPSRSTIESWSSAFHWQDRLLDLERQATERDREQQLRTLQEMAERHAREGLALQQKGVERLQSLPAEQLSPADAVRALIEGVRLERLARGEPTDRIVQREEESHAPIDLRRFTNEELRRLAELADRHAPGAGEEEPR
jgi:uncharacterized protein YoaH (UPF0181 family)